MRSKMKNTPLSTYEKVIAVITWVWRNDQLTCLWIRRYRRNEWYFGLPTSRNHLSMYSIYSPSFLMPCRSSSFECSIAWVHEESVDIYVENYSISSCSLSNVVSKFLVSLVDWKGEFFFYLMGIWLLWYF